MSFSKYLVFDIWGDYAHFKKYYTTSSPLTFSVPPRTVIIGIIGAILGFNKDEYLKIMNKSNAKIAIRILNPIKKIRFSINLINTKDGYWTPIKIGSHSPRTPVTFEFLKSPKFRVYFAHADSTVYKKFRDLLKKHECVYTPYLGISELIANFEFIEETEVVEQIKEYANVLTVIPIDSSLTVEFETGKRYFKDRIPVDMIEGRIVNEYKEIIFEANGSSIKALNNDFIRLKNGNVIAIL
ncbi:MAG TPA: type I-B CRISPR-associated protein Cas5b [bacterium]|nr:type I-B CRISPR-associated protein Cas5b [bacterium]